MLPLQLRPQRGRPVEVLAVGAHADDIEIGCGGTILHLAAAGFPLHVTWVVLAAAGVREREAVASAAAFLKDVEQTTVVLKSFRDGFFPWAGADVKEVFEDLKGEVDPDLVIAPHRHDAHQDHRLVAELTWNTFRDHLVLEYEIPKYDGDTWATPTCSCPCRPRPASARGFAEAFHCRKATLDPARGGPRLSRRPCAPPPSRWSSG